jgi:hypothetical protein
MICCSISGFSCASSHGFVDTMGDSISVIQADLNNGLEQYFSDNSFDYVVMSQILQAMDRPDILERPASTRNSRHHACHQQSSQSLVRYAKYPPVHGERV